MKNDVTTQPRTRKPITDERVFDLMMDIRIRSNRNAETSISEVLTEHRFGQGTALSLASCGVIAKEGREYQYTGKIITLDLAKEVVADYYLRQDESKTTKAKSDLHISEVEYEEQPEAPAKNEALEALNSHVAQLLTIARTNASTLHDIKTRLVRLESKVHVSAEDVAALRRTLVKQGEIDFQQPVRIQKTA